MKKILCLTLVALLSGCAAAPRGPLVRSAAELGERGWALTVSADVPEPYYVLSGPGQSYKSFRLQEGLAARLSSVLAARPAPAGREALLRVHLAAVTTGFEEVGAPAPDGNDSPSLGGLAGHPGAPVVTKRVGLELRASFATGGETVEKPIRVEAVEVIDVAHYDPRWAYGYDDVVDEALAKAARAVEAFVSAALAGGSVR